jgi:hypothetical protein
MKNLRYIFLGLGVMALWSCSDDEKLTNNEEMTSNVCEDDFAEYSVNDTVFATMHLPNQGEILTTSGESCGIGAVIDENQNNLILRIVGEEQALSIHADVTNINVEEAFRFLEYTNNDVTTSFTNLLDDENFILVEELDTSASTIKGTFNFKIENSLGDTITVTNGVFNCSFHSF